MDLKGEKGDIGVRGPQGVRGLCGLSADGVTDADNFEAKADKVLEITEESTHDNYPSAKAVVDYVKSTKDKWVAFEEIPDSFYYISKNDDGSWSANSDTGSSLPNMREGETYKFISDLATMEITLDNWDGGYFKAYSEDGKTELWLTGILIQTEEDAEYWGYPIGTLTGGQATIYYDSAIGEPINGVPMEEIPWESDGWTGECYFYECDMNVEHLEAQKIDYRYLPEDIATKDDIPEIPENLESTTYKIQSINDMNDEADKQYPSARLFLDELTKFEQNAMDYANNTFGGVFGDITTLQGQTNWELIDVYELTEDVVQITPRMYSGQYKELYWVFDIPPMSEIDTTDKARFYLLPVADKTTVNGAKLIQQGNTTTPNPADEWKLMFHSKVFGEYARTEIWFVNNTTLISGAYGRTPDGTTQNGMVAPFAILPNPYIDGLTLIMTSSNGGRVFPAGTKYELWGVKA